MNGSPSYYVGRVGRVGQADELTLPVEPKPAWQKQQADGSLLVGFDNGEVWRKQHAFDRATERRTIRWTLHGHWDPTDPREPRLATDSPVRLRTPPGERPWPARK